MRSSPASFVALTRRRAGGRTPWAVLGAFVLAACGGGGGGSSTPAPPPLAAAGSAYATTSTNALITFNVAEPGTILSTTPITGLQAGETIRALDLRPGSSDLLALGTAGRVYRIHPTTAAATELSAAPFAGVLGASFGWDVDPNSNEIRVVSDADANARANASTGAFVGNDTLLAYAAGDPQNGTDPNVVALAYTISTSASAPATAYAIDGALGNLVRLGGPGGTPAASTGQLFTVGTLGVGPSTNIAFDIAGGSDRAYAAIFGGAASAFYRIDLTSGAATLIGSIGAAPTTVTGLAVVPEQAPTLLALTSAGNLVTFRADAPGTILSSVAVSGLAMGETLVGLDIRPATGQLFGVGSTSRLYVVDQTSGVATAVGSAGAFTLTGTAFGVDFNPTVDRLRVVSDADQNLRLVPTGALAGTDTPLQYAPADVNSAANPNVVALAYTNSVPRATTTVLYGIDSNLDVLVRQDPPNAGTLNTVGALGFNTSDRIGFDIVPETDTAFASFTAPAASTSSLHRISLANGASTPLGAVGVAATLTALVVLPDAGSAGADSVLWVVDGVNALYRVNASNPSVATAGPTAITGLAVGEVVLGIDARPSTGQVFLLGDSDRLYTLDTSTGAATLVGMAGQFTVGGTHAGFDFNPVPDLIRITTDVEQNLRVNPDGTLNTTDTALAYGVADPNFGTDPTIVASAYTGVAGTASTTLFNLDAGLNILVQQNPPNAGVLISVGALGVTLQPGGPASFDIDPLTGRSFVAGTVNLEVTSRLFVINLTTGALTGVGTLPGVLPVRGLAVQR